MNVQNPHQSSGSPRYMDAKLSFSCNGAVKNAHLSIKMQKRLGNGAWVDVPNSQNSIGPFDLGAAAVVAGASGLAVWWWANGGPPVLRFIDSPTYWTEPIFVASLVVAAAAANSIYEEVLWRHLLPVALGGPQLWVTIVLSLGFGAAHINSLPSGLSGVVMTTAFASVSHALVKASNGSLLPSIGAHFVADVVLLTAVLT